MVTNDTQREQKRGMNGRALPKLNVSMSDREWRRLERLADLRGVKKSRALADAVIHVLASLELHEPVHTVIPSEQSQREED